MKRTRDSISLNRTEMEQFLGGAKICECGSLYPQWEWAKRKSTCPLCKERPSQEDVTGKREAWTPADWKPKR